MGGAWGINRTMAQVHALLMTSEKALTTDEVMAELKISRGNAHQNLRELVGWGLVRNVIRKGERKEYYESEKEVWRMFCTIARERKRREIEPALPRSTGRSWRSRNFSRRWTRSWTAYRSPNRAPSCRCCSRCFPKPRKNERTCHENRQSHPPPQGQNEALSFDEKFHAFSKISESQKICASGFALTLPINSTPRIP
jgi:hypothetical protein